MPPVRGKVGRPRQRPDRLTADRGYDSAGHRRQLRRRGITPEIARRKTDHGSGLGRHRWVVERTFARLHQFKRLLVRYDRRHDIHEAFLALACRVQIACKLQGFKVADGNPWWYRIASAPWNSAFYVPADNFYNNGATSGSLRGTPWVDGAVGDC